MHKLNHILIVDDDEINNVFTQIILEDADISHRTSVCQSVPEAFDFLRNSEQHQEPSFPDLILLDLTMPYHDGFTFLEYYYQAGFQETQDAVIIILSSSEEEELKKRALSYCVVQGFLQKPLSLVMLQNLLSTTAKVQG
ncbi:response regulator [Pontibacter roseus]|uniref:response regulator n=1 Tax=Pontibacter roseus TaxID=336989 RepID=UPI0003738FB8|nr:response regulator [Pontibacter roseus]